jgi:hypothetical protein
VFCFFVIVLLVSFIFGLIMFKFIELFLENYCSFIIKNNIIMKFFSFLAIILKEDKYFKNNSILKRNLPSLFKLLHRRNLINFDRFTRYIICEFLFFILYNLKL